MKSAVFFKRFNKAEISFRASALSFHTLLSLVPILGLILWFLQSIGVTEKWRMQFQDYVLSHLNVSSGEFLVSHLNIMTHSVSGTSWGTVGLGIFIFTAGNIVMRLGNSLDKILGTAPVDFDWTKSVLLTVAKRLLVLLCLPIVFLSSILIAEWVKDASWIHFLVKIETLSQGYFRFLPWLLDFMGIFAVYRFIPQHKVSYRQAMKAAIYIVPIYELTKAMFTRYNHYAITTHQVYGAFSAIPIFFLWIYIAWILLLSGALFIKVPNKKVKKKKSEKFLMRIKVIAIVASLFASDLWSGPYQANMPIEIYQGPIFSNSKILGMGGASIGVAEGAGAQSTNPAALANRIIYDELSNFDWDVLFEYLVDISAETKIENNGRDTNPADKIDLTSMGGLIQYKKWGYGLVANGLTHEMCVEESASDCSDPNKNVHFSAVNAYLGAGKSFSKGKYLFGANLVGSYIDLGTKKNVDLVSLSGVGLQLGFLWKDPDKNYRLGMSLRSPVNVRADSESNKNKVLGLQAPQKTSLPWNIGFGFSYYWGARQFNKRQDFSKRSSYLKEQKLPRRYYLLAADLVVVGIQKNAVGIESWLLQEDQSAGDFLGLSPRVGFETEFWPNRLKGRIGTYREPSRFHDVDGRLHGTFGFDLRLFRLWDWDLQLTSAFDFSNQYQNLIVSIFSFWH